MHFYKFLLDYNEMIWQGRSVETIGAIQKKLSEQISILEGLLSKPIGATSIETIGGISIVKTKG